MSRNGELAIRCLSTSAGRTGWISGTLALAVLLLVGASPSGAVCGKRTVAWPVPEALWPPDFRPTDPPDRPLPPLRDSTSYQTQCPAGAQFGLELRTDIQVLDNYAFVAYNAGLEVWDIGPGHEEDPKRVAFADGWSCFGYSCRGIRGSCGGKLFLKFPAFGEVEGFIDDIDVLQGPDDVFLIALSGRVPVGLTLWTFDPAIGRLSAVYQDPNHGAASVKIREHDGKYYVFSATTAGVDVYNMSTALAVAPCLDSTGSGCGGVYRGKVGDMSKGAWVDAVVAHPGRLHIVASDGTSAAPLTLEIWEVPDPDAPGGAIERFNGAGIQSLVHAPVFFEHGGVHYLAFVEKNSTENRIRIYDVQTCLDASGPEVCQRLGTEMFSTELLFTGTRQKLTFSESSTVDGKTPFLHYGFPDVNLYGPRIDLLLNLSTLGGTNAITEMTDGAPTYFDHCVNQDLSYWAWYYKGNEFGFNQYAPSAGVFNGAYFYRVNYATFDVHLWGGGGGPPPHATVMASALGNPPYWMGDPTTFDATATDCEPTLDGWCWTATPSTAEVRSGPVPCGGDATDPQTFFFSCDRLAGRCADASVEVSAWNASCGDQAEGTTIPDTIQVTDPTVEITSVEAAGDSFPSCRTIDFAGGLVGRGPVTWSWTIAGEPQPQCDGSETGKVDLSGTAVSCTFDPSSLAFDGIFADGFESGELNAWTSSQGATVPWTGARSPIDLTVLLTVSNGAVLDQDRLVVSITEAAPPSFDGPPTASLSGTTLTLTYPALSTVTWHWELEDPSGASTCDFSTKTGVPCAVAETTADTVSHTWADAGTFAYKVRIVGCDPLETDEAEGEVTVDAGNLPSITSFALNGSQAACCGNPFNLPIKCQAGQVVEFKVRIAAAGSWGFGFDWDRASSTETPGYVAQSPGGSSDTDWYFRHSFSSPGTVYPIVEVTSGPFADEETYNFAPLEITSGPPSCF